VGKKKDKGRKRRRWYEVPLPETELPIDGSEPERSALRRLDGAARPVTVVDPAELAARLAGLSTVLQRHLARAESGDGLTRARISALALLVLGGPRTLGRLAAAERVRPPTMTRLVHAMEVEGLVVRELNPGDGRSVIVRATAGAESLLASGRTRQLAPLAAAIEGLDTDERRRLDDAAELLGRVLRDTGWDAADPTA
jgi:DNA-binding MarR family transcriptional regulator